MALSLACASGSNRGCSPIFLNVNVPFQFNGGLVDLEAAFAEDFDDARRLRVDGGAGGFVDFGGADHFGVAAQVDVSSGRVEGVAEAFFELAAGDEVLDVKLLA